MASQDSWSLWTVAVEGKTFVSRGSRELRLSLRNMKKTEKQTIRSLYREPNSWLTAVRYYAVLNWLERIPSPPSLFVLPLKKSSSLAMKTRPRHESQNMRRYGDINHERGGKKKQPNFIWDAWGRDLDLGFPASSI